MSYAWLARKQAEICGAHNSFFSVIRRDLKSYKRCGFSRIHFGLAVAVAVAVGFGFRIWFSILILMILCVSHSVQHNLWLRWADTKMARQAGRQGERRAERGSKPIMLTFITCNRVIFCELLSLFGNASHVPYKWLHIFKDIMLTVEIECALRHILSHTKTHTHTDTLCNRHTYSEHNFTNIYWDIDRNNVMNSISTMNSFITKRNIYNPIRFGPFVTFP